ncbi:unnamed protein product [Ophioblennius macclurei]
MWKRSGRSSALDRAQGLLAAKRSGGGAGGGGTRGNVQGATRGSINSRPAEPSFSDLSDESSVSLAAELQPSVVKAAKAGETFGAQVDVQHQSPQGGQSRFLKKPPPPTSSSQSQAVPEPRCVPSSQRSSQTAALSRLALIESRVQIRKQALDQTRWGTKPVNKLTSDISPPIASQSPVVPEAAGDHRLKGKHFLKNRAIGAAGDSALESPDAGVRFRTAEPAVPLGRLQQEPLKVMSSVSLESDEEDMRRLLGNSLDSSDNGSPYPGQNPSIKTHDKMSGRGGLKVSSPRPPRSPAPLHAAASPLPPSPHRPHESPPRRQASPFRFTGQAQARFSPSALSPPPSPSSAGRSVSSCSFSSTSGRREVMSLEELFPTTPRPEEPHSDASSISSGDFMINVRSLDELVPDTVGLATETPRKETRNSGNERKTKQIITSSLDDQVHPGRGEEEEEEEKKEEEYQSDFESETRSDPSASQVSEDVQSDGDEQEVVSEVRSEGSRSSRGKTENDYSSAFSDSSRTPFSRRRDSESWTSSQSQSEGRRVRRPLKEAAVQTQPHPLAHAWWSGGAAPTYMDSTPVLTHSVEALSAFNPALFTVSEMLKQQLAVMTCSIQSSQQRHSRLLQSLEPPNYRYTTLEDTQQMMKKRRAPKLSMEEALVEVRQEMGECN